MEAETHYRITEHNVAHEIIDGEAVVINLDTGIYYSLEGASAQIWQWFTPGSSRSQVLGAFKDLQPPQVQKIDELIGFLLKEELLVPEPEGQSATAIPQNEILFESLKFTKYNDMQDQLLSDPIPEIEETDQSSQAMDRV